VKDKEFKLTWRLGPEGLSEEVTKIRSGSTALFFGGGDGFRRSFSVASSMVFSCKRKEEDDDGGGVG
jgi:hypothetical protein